jgi:hypothetical protein
VKKIIQNGGCKNLNFEKPLKFELKNPLKYPEHSSQGTMTLLSTI